MIQGVHFLGSRPMRSAQAAATSTERCMFSPVLPVPGLRQDGGWRLLSISPTFISKPSWPARFNGCSRTNRRHRRDVGDCNVRDDMYLIYFELLMCDMFLSVPPQNIINSTHTARLPCIAVCRCAGITSATSRYD